MDNEITVTVDRQTALRLANEGEVPVSTVAKFGVGDVVFHVNDEDYATPAVVEDRAVVGFPEYIGPGGDTSALTVGYTISFRGPEGVGWEEEDGVPEQALRLYGGGAP